MYIMYLMLISGNRHHNATTDSQNKIILAGLEYVCHFINSWNVQESLSVVYHCILLNLALKLIEKELCLVLSLQQAFIMVFLCNINFQKNHCCAINAAKLGLMCAMNFALTWVKHGIATIYLKIQSQQYLPHLYQTAYLN